MFLVTVTFFNIVHDTRFEFVDQSWQFVSGNMFLIPFMGFWL